jgi:phenylalanyl-tRNA synthetase beta chain
MKLSYQWLRELVNIPDNPQELIEKLTNAGLKLEDQQPIDNDLMIDLEITVNRPDCLSHFGVAREIAAMYQMQPASLPEIAKPEIIRVIGTEGQYTFGPVPLTIILEDPELCPRYCGVILTGIKVGLSPAWMRQKLETCGVRSINNVVDVTNYVMLELGQPLHAFDYKKVAGGTIRVRRGRNERLLMIDGKERLMTDQMLVIADAHRASGVGGIMGGKESEVSDQTTTVLLESAYFQPASIRKTRRSFDLSTDASYRFERGADPKMQDIAALRAARLFEQIAGAQVHGLLDVSVLTNVPKVVELRPARIERILGKKLDTAYVNRLLEALGFQKKGDQNWEVPSWRVDIQREIDLIEEAARHYGYNNFPNTLPKAESKYQPDYPTYHLERDLSQFMRAARIDEALIYSFTNSKATNENPVRILNPISDGFATMRSSLIPGLLESIDYNLRHRSSNEIRLFEIGRVFSTAGEQTMLGIAMTGEYRDLKGILEGAFPAVRFPKPVIRSGRIIVNESDIGEIKQADIDGNEIQTCEFSLDKLIEIPRIETRYKPIIPYPYIERDVSFLLPESAPFASLEAKLMELNIPELRSYKLIDRYRGKTTPEGKISLTFRLVFQSENRTLLSEEVDALYARIVDEFGKIFGAELRK